MEKKKARTTCKPSNKNKENKILDNKILSGATKV